MSLKSSRERGAALLIVMLQVATISVIAVGIAHHVLQSMQIVAVSTARGQALWFTLGAEDIAKAQLSQLVTATEGRIDRRTPRLNEPILLQIGDARMFANVRDQSNCFNVNSLVQGEDESGALNASAFLTEMLVALDFPESAAEETVSALRDWIDADNLPSQRGAETNYYAGLEFPYAAADTLMSTPQEMRAVRGIDAQVYKRIRPLICVRPNTQIGPFNINTLREYQAPLLVPVFSSEIVVSTLAAELRSAEPNVFASVDEFLAIPAFQLIAEDKKNTSLLDIKSTHFHLSGEVVYLESVTSYEAVFAVNDTGVSLLRRRFGVDE